MRWFATLLLLVLLLPGRPGAAEMRSVDLALVLLTDVSRSVDQGEYTLIKRGYEAALADPKVIAAIRGGPIGAVALTYVEFAGAHEVRTLVDWTVVNDEASARAFAARVQELVRSFWGRTSIASGIEHAMAELQGRLAEEGIEPSRRAIDVCGDGTNNSGADVQTARDLAVAAGMTVNALVIHSEPMNAWTAAHVQPPGGLTNYFRENVIGGVGAFVMEVQDFASFGTGLTRKLISEIAGEPGGPRRFAARAQPAVRPLAPAFDEGQRAGDTGLSERGK